MSRCLALLVFVALAACSDERPPEPTSAESAQLNEAEDMLNALDENALDEKEGAAPTGTAPPTNQN